MAATGMTTRVHAAAEANSLKARDLGPILRVREAVAEPPDGLDEVYGKLLAQTADEHLDGVRVAVEVLLVEMLDELGARHDAIPVQHEVGENAVLVGRELDALPVHRDPCRPRIQTERPAFHLIAGMTG